MVPELVPAGVDAQSLRRKIEWKSKQLFKRIDGFIVFSNHHVDMSQRFQMVSAAENIHGNRIELHRLLTFTDGLFFSAKPGVSNSQRAIKPGVIRPFFKLVLEKTEGRIKRKPGRLGLVKVSIRHPG